MADGQQQCLVINFTVKLKIICMCHTLQNPISECISAMASKILYLTFIRVEPMMGSILPLERSGGFN